MTEEIRIHSKATVRDSSLPYATLRPSRAAALQGTLQVARADENRPVRFWAAGEIFPPSFLFDARSVASEYSELVLAIPVEVVVQSFPADMATYPSFSVLPPEHDNIPTRIILLVRSGKLQSMPVTHVEPLRKQSRHPS